jgi:predicted nucleic acid-binding protein
MPAESLKIIKNHLETSIGEIGVKSYQKSISKLNIGENPSKDAVEKLISNIEGLIKPLYGNDKSKAILDELHKKLAQGEKSEVPKDIEKEINAFLTDHHLPTEKDIADYAKYLSIRYGGNAQNVEKNLIEKVKIHIIDEIGKKKINIEMNNFLSRYQEPTEKDVGDFIRYLRINKLDFQENMLREHIENERLFRKFHGPQETPEATELDQFINFVKTSDNKEAISKSMQKQGLTYLIKDETGISDKSLSEFVKLVTPDEKDVKNALEDMGLDHLIGKK